jgi:hypothetical protein
VLCKEHHFACHDFIKNWRARGWKEKSTYTLTMKYISREKKKRQKGKNDQIAFQPALYCRPQPLLTKSEGVGWDELR